MAPKENKEKKGRRYAQACTFVEESSNEGYKKYLIDIVEEDGSLTVGVPAYGYDMQDAIARLIRTERNQKITRILVNKVEPGFLMFMAAGWITCMMISAITSDYRYAYWSVMTVFSTAVIYSIFSFFRKTKNKK